MVILGISALKCLKLAKVEQNAIGKLLTHWHGILSV